MRVLVLSNYLPYPLLTGGRIRIYNLLRRVASRHEVSLAALLESPEDAEGIPHLRTFCARVETAPFPAHQRSRLAKAPGMLRYVLQGRPPDLMLLHSEELVTKIRQLFSRVDFDIVQIEQFMGLYLEALPRKKSYKTLQMFHNVESQNYARIAQVERRWYRRVRASINGVVMRHWEHRYAERFDRCTTVSELDQQLLKKANPRLQIDVIPNGVDTQKFQLLPQVAETVPSSLIFVGNMGYPPCIDAVLYFCGEVLPLIRQLIDSVEVRIVGCNPPPEVLKLNGNGVHVTGRVEDVIPYYQQSAACVVPLRAGSGTRLKILEAMALGRPVVCTTVGCEGLDVVNGEHLLIGDTPERFAESTVRLLRDLSLSQSIRVNARKLVEARYGWDNIADRLMWVYEDLAQNSGTRSR
jgi:polysaccharide biosynthesis protein PslH